MPSKAFYNKRPALSLPKGFTLIELLIVIGIIVVIAAAIIIAVSPGEQLARARNATRERHGHGLRQAILSYQIGKGEFPEEIGTLLKEVCNTGSEDTSHTIDCTNKANLSILVEEGYIGSIPQDPLRGSEDTGAGYFVAKSYDGNSLGLVQGLKEIQCEEGWIGVPGNTMYGTQDFCIMKYEAKNVDGTATSQPAGTSWVSISQVNSISECQAIGANLITNPQWMTIARNIEAVPGNWSDGSVGSGHLSRGWTAADWSDGFQNTAQAPNAEPSCLYNTGANTCGASGDHKLKRTLNLTNGETIWDFSGNVWNWVDYTISGANSQPQDPYKDSYGWEQIKDITDWGNTLSYDMVGSGNNNWTSTQNIGRVYYDSTETNERAFHRGGSWSNGTDAGAFALYLSNLADWHEHARWFPLRPVLFAL